MSETEQIIYRAKGEVVCYICGARDYSSVEMPGYAMCYNCLREAIQVIYRGEELERMK
jgi:hypothetical protein